MRLRRTTSVAERFKIAGLLIYLTAMPLRVMPGGPGMMGGVVMGYEVVAIFGFYAPLVGGLYGLPGLAFTFPALLACCGPFIDYSPRRATRVDRSKTARLIAARTRRKITKWQTGLLWLGAAALVLLPPLLASEGISVAKRGWPHATPPIEWVPGAALMWLGPALVAVGCFMQRFERADSEQATPNC